MGIVWESKTWADNSWKSGSWREGAWGDFYVAPVEVKRGVPGSVGRARADGEYEETLRMLQMDRIMKDDIEILKIIEYALSEIL